MTKRRWLKRNYWWWQALGWMVVAGALLLMEQGGWLVGVRGLAEKAVLPLEARVFASGQKIVGWLDFFQHWRNQRLRIADLQRQVAELSVEAVRVEELEVENQSLRQAVGAPLPVAAVRIPAKVVGRSEYLLVAEGEEMGIEPGGVVVDEVGMVVGLVVEVRSQVSLVNLLTDVSTRIAARLRGTETEGVMVGTGTGLRLEEVVQGEEVAEEMVVVTSGAEGIYPAGLVLGRVKQVGGKPAAVYRQVEVEPLFSIHNLSCVYILKL
jgi:rod shape-determining protein MreC